MTDNVFPQGPDGLFDLQKVLARDNVSDYVESGISFGTPDWANDQTDISAGTAVIRDGDLAFIVEPDSRTDVTLPSSTGVNYVYLAFDPDTNNEITYHVDTDDTPPADPSLKVGELDAGAQTATEVNREPSATFDEVASQSSTTEQADITNSLTYGSHDIGAILESETAGERVARGIETSIGPTTASSTDDFSDATKSNHSVTFATAFSAKPDVYVQPDKVADEPLFTNPLNRSTTGFDIGVSWWSTASPNQRDVTWVAIGDD